VRSINPELCEGLLDFICLGRLGTNTGSVSLGFPYCSSRGEALLVRQKKRKESRCTAGQHCEYEARGGCAAKLGLCDIESGYTVDEVRL
jgi:hypothetical protein